MPNFWSIGRYKFVIRIPLFIHFTLLGIVIGKMGEYLNSHSSNSKMPFRMEIGKIFFAWITYGSRIALMDSTPKVQIYVSDGFSFLYLGLYVTYMALGTVMGVGKTCRANLGLCFLDHLCTFMALPIIGFMVFDIVASAKCVFNYNSQGEEAQTEKDKKKRYSNITFDEYGLDPLSEQTIVPNPSGGNPGSKPNQGL
ncbi:hypothetical protein BGW39_007975 [Mortierella sp. 14UC]|nr:hypothetical protein BGW39_007975 [Mortierella sp. 14UC]